MKYSPLFLSVVLCLFAILPATPLSAAEPEVAWVFQEPSKDHSAGIVQLRVNGEVFPLNMKSAAPYKALLPSEYSGYSIPKSALLAAYSWYAGSGDVVYVIQKENELEIYSQEMDESEAKPYPAKKFMTLKLP